MSSIEMEYDFYFDQDFPTDANKCLIETTIYTKSAAQERRREILNRVQSIMCTVPDGVVSRILHFYRWREDKAIELFLTDVVKLLKIIRIPQPELVSICHKIPLPDQILCPICLVETNDFGHLGCGHFFCRPCWRSYLEIELKPEQVPSRELPCMADKCSHPISESFVRELGLSSETVQRFEDYLLVRFVRAKKGLFPCQAAGCTNVIENPIREGDAFVSICSCGHRFCPRCTAGYHSPLSCDSSKAVNLHIEELQRVYRQVESLRTEVKTCSKCYSPNSRPPDVLILHKTCVTCGFSFCWICQNEWSDLVPHQNCLDSANEPLAFLQRWQFVFDWKLMSDKDFNEHKCDIIRRADLVNINIDISFLQEIRAEVVYGRSFLEHSTRWLENICIPAEKDLHSLRRDSYSLILKALNDSLLQFLIAPSERTLERMKHQTQSLSSMRKTFFSSEGY